MYWMRAVILRFSESGSAVSKSTETSWMPGYPALSISWWALRAYCASTLETQTGGLGMVVLMKR